jgi:hypothetical protein
MPLALPGQANASAATFRCHIVTVAKYAPEPIFQTVLTHVIELGG